MSDCKICTVSKKHPLTIFESTHWIIILAHDQTYLGRCYVTAKEHRESLSSLTKDEWEDLHEAIQKIEYAISKAFGADLFNWSCLMNDAFYNSSTGNPHVHWHIKPRYSKTITLNKIVFTDKEFGRHYRTKWDGREDYVVDDATMKIIKQKILENL